MKEPFPLGTLAERLDWTTNMILAETIIDIPLLIDSSGSQVYQIPFDNGTSASIPLNVMPSLIPPPPLVLVLAPEDSSQDPSSSLLPPFLSLNSQITNEHNSAYHKEFLTRKPCGTYRFSFKTHFKKKVEDWGVNIPNLPFMWVNLCTEGILVPGHVAQTFLCTSSPSLPLPSASPPSTFDLVVNIVSAINLHWDCPPILLQALALSHPNCEVWLQSYCKEKNGIEELGMFKCLTLSVYRILREKGASKAIPTICVLTIKKDEQLIPLRATSRIVVLGNLECRDWLKSDYFAPVFWFDSLYFLVSFAVQGCHGLKQGDCKSIFCQGVLPPDEIKIVCPPSGDLDVPKDGCWLFQMTLYGLHCSPCHWNQRIDSILCMFDLTPNPHDPCFYTGFVCDPRNVLTVPSAVPLSLGLYVDDFVYFLENPDLECLFKHLLQERIKVDFMGLAERFLGIHFS